jgi:hypothetical protein
MKALELDTTRDLEDLCINTIYASLLTGKLSPRTQTFQITSCTSRDLSPGAHDYTGMITTLTQWSTQCDLVLAEITGRIRDVKADAAERKVAEDKYEGQLEFAKKAAAPWKPPKMKKSNAVSQGLKEDVDAIFMQDVEKADLTSPRALVGGGDKSPSGRKRKLVRPQS